MFQARDIYPEKGWNPVEHAVLLFCQGQDAEQHIAYRQENRAWVPVLLMAAGGKSGIRRNSRSGGN